MMKHYHNINRLWTQGFCFCLLLCGQWFAMPLDGVAAGSMTLRVAKQERSAVNLDLLADEVWNNVDHNPSLSLLLAIEATRLDPTLLDTLLRPVVRYVEISEHVTNQNMVDAFYTVARRQELEDSWQLLNQAGLKLDWLVSQRDKLYRGTPLRQLKGLTPTDLQQLQNQLSELVGLKSIEQSQHTFYHDTVVETLSFSDDGRRLIAQSGDGNSTAWAMTTAMQTGPTPENQASFNLISRLNGDETTSIINLTSNSELARLSLNQPMTDLAASADGAWLALAYGDGNIRLYLVDEPRLIDLACEYAGRNLSQREWNSYIGAAHPYQRSCHKLHELFDAVEIQPEQQLSIEAVTALDTLELDPAVSLKDLPELTTIELAPAESQMIWLADNASMNEKRTARSWNSYGGLVAVIARRLHVDVGLAISLVTRESGGQGFNDSGRLLIRFETHLFYRRWGQHHPEQFFQHFQFNQDYRWLDHRWRPTVDEPWRSFHGDQQAEWAVFDFARTLDETAALSSITMGGPQILGSNYARLGYDSPQAMFANFSDPAHGERYQLLGLFDFIRNGDARMLQALQQRDIYAFAQRYDGHQSHASSLEKLYNIFNILKPA